MDRSKLACLLLGAVAASGCSREAVAPNPIVEKPAAATTTSSEFGVEKSEALAGDPEAAAFLQHAYFKMDEREYRRWLQIGAENGHAISQYNLAYELWSNGTALEDDQIRAKFWLGRAAASGHSDSAAALARISEGRKW